ncbi:outer membrane beta-barrel protein [Pseudocolwellia agarivorans]|uniref:outer membrane beta-barrel protein n=1 Tax=Pseudocolwellia agarivorans TaxID=1911682 RepID=UPI003F882D21
MKRNKNISPILKRIVKHSYLLLLIPAISVNAEESSGLLLNGNLTVEHTDNVLNNLNEVSDTAIIVNPQFKYLSLVGKHKFQLIYDGNLVTYTKDSDLSYNDHKLGLSASLDHSHKLSSQFNIGFDKGIEQPGSTNTSTVGLTDFNQYKTKSAAAKLTYGKKSSIGQIVVGYKYDDRDFTNNQQDYRDFSLSQFNAVFYYRIAPKTRLLFQASTTQFHYDDLQISTDVIFNQSSIQNVYLTGVEWTASAKTSGVFKIGYQTKDYDDIRFNDISGLSYMIDGIWKPNTFTKIKLSAERQTTESALLNEGGFLSTSYSLDVAHSLTSLTKISAKYSIDKDEIVSISNRTDDRNTLTLTLSHSLKKWLDIKLGYKYQEKKSNIDIFNFESNTLQLSIETKFN